MKMYTIYRIYNNVDDKSYVGQTSDLHTRTLAHFTRLKAGAHINTRLQEAYNRFGADVFKVEVLEKNVLAKHVDNREIHWIEVFDAHENGYNVVKRGAHRIEGQPLEYQQLTQEGVRIADEWRALGQIISGLSQELAEIEKEHKRLYRMMKDIDRRRKQILAEKNKSK